MNLVVLDNLHLLGVIKSLLRVLGVKSCIKRCENWFSFITCFGVGSDGWEIVAVCFTLLLQCSLLRCVLVLFNYCTVLDAVPYYNSCASISCTIRVHCMIYQIVTNFQKDLFFLSGFQRLFWCYDVYSVIYDKWLNFLPMWDEPLAFQIVILYCWNDIIILGWVLLIGQA